MENKKYLVCRDDICVGEVIRTNSGVYRYEGEGYLFRIKSGQLTVDSWKSYRSMLFVPNDNKLSNDLLYDCPSYPIFNVTYDEVCLKLPENSVAIQDSYNLSGLLEYFGYGRYLTIEDIVKIRNMFFTGRFGMDNSRLFGMKEFIPDSFEPNITDQNDRYELYKMSVNLGSERQFGSISTNELPRELMSILDIRGISGFEAPQEEGPIKKLTMI